MYDEANFFHLFFGDYELDDRNLNYRFVDEMIENEVTYGQYLANVPQLATEEQGEELEVE